MSLSEREIDTIHSNTSFIDGNKYFGNYDDCVTRKVTTERILGNQELAVEAVIFVPVMERAEKFSKFLENLKESIDSSQRAVSLVILDNSLENKFLQTIHNTDFGSSVSEIYYHHDPRMTQSTGRNYAFKNFSHDCQIIGLWDSDIYPSPASIGELLNVLEHYPDISGIAPPLGGFGGGIMEVARGIYRNLQNNKPARLKLHMPGEIGEENGQWKDNILRTTMMRGSFMIKKEIVQKISSLNNGNPWYKDFILWQNVPFFIAAREQDFDFGYLMRDDTVVLHDIRRDNLSVTNEIVYRRGETLKSIVLLMYRNKVFTNIGKEINLPRFLKYNLESISRVTGFSAEQAAKFQDVMLKIAEKLDESEDVSELKIGNVPQEFSEITNEIVNLLNYEPVFSRVKKMESSKPLRQIYSI